jgi:hypothetical protein
LQEEGFAPIPKRAEVTASVVEVNSSPASRELNQRTNCLSVSELHLWRRQAQVIGRSPSHLQAIDSLLQVVQKDPAQSIDISPKTYKVRQIDLEDFNQLAFRLIRLVQSPNTHKRAKSGQSQLITKKLRLWRRLIERWIQKFVLTK